MTRETKLRQQNVRLIAALVRISVSETGQPGRDKQMAEWAREVLQREGIAEQ